MVYYAQEAPDNTIEAVVKVVNIGYNEGSEVLGKSDILREYASFISACKDKISDGMDNDIAVRMTLNEFVERNSVLNSFLKMHENEVTDMLGDATKEEYGALMYEEGLDTGIAGTVRALKKLGISYEVTKNMIIDEYRLSEEVADEYMKKYWQRYLFVKNTYEDMNRSRD